ncbi:monocarboxylate transporter 13-like [Ptychodera flava]|uniref:monocarboxylate transporter 13-like n=1 Tax=Ptychodera flava TaxID=63121 RepID=UPI003969CECE
MTKKRLSSVSKVQPEVLDGGHGWFVVVASCIVLFFCLGVNASMGPFFVALRHYFQESASKTSWISATVSFLVMSTGPIANKATTQFGCRAVVMFGGFLSSAGFVISSFATSIYQLYFSFGILVGFSYGLIFSPSVAFLGKYFNRRHALANSLAFAGVGVAIICLSPLFQTLIDAYGWRGAMVVLAGMNLNICVAGALYRPPPTILSQAEFRRNSTNVDMPVKETVPGGGDQCEAGKKERCNLCSVCTFFGINCNLLCDSYRYAMLPYITFTMGYGYYAIVVHLLPRAIVKGVDWTKAPFLVSIFGILSLIGRFAHGGLLHTMKFISAFQMCVGSLVVCGLGTALSGFAWTFEAMVVYCVVLGFTSGTFLPVVPVAIKDFLGGHNLGSAYPLVNIFMGVGGIIGPPLSGWLYDMTDNYDIPFIVSGVLLMSTMVTLFMDPCLKKLDDKLDAEETASLSAKPGNDEMEAIKVTSVHAAQGDDKVDTAECTSSSETSDVHNLDGIVQNTGV